MPYTLCLLKKRSVYVFIYKNDNFNKSCVSLGSRKAQGQIPLLERPRLTQAPVLCRMACASCSEEAQTVNDSLRVCDTGITRSIKCGTSCQPSQLSSSISVRKCRTEGRRCQLPSSNNHWSCPRIRVFREPV